LPPSARVLYSILVYSIFFPIYFISLDHIFIIFIISTTCIQSVSATKMTLCRFMIEKNLISVLALRRGCLRHISKPRRSYCMWRCSFFIILFFRSIFDTNNSYYLYDGVVLRAFVVCLFKSPYINVSINEKKIPAGPSGDFVMKGQLQVQATLSIATQTL